MFLRIYILLKDCTVIKKNNRSEKVGTLSAMEGIE